MLYFAYGSNMSFREMRDRCPSAQFVAAAKLAHHQLVFTRFSETRDGGVADAAPQHDEAVWGVVYDIPEIEFGRLDKSEGYIPGQTEPQNRSVRKQRLVCRDGHEADPLLVWSYFSNREGHTSGPNSTYRGCMLDGARFWHLPEDYVQELERLEVV